MTVKVLCKYDELLDPKALTPHVKNRNTHPEAQLKRLAKMIKKVGWRAPIIISKNSKMIVKGNGTREAAIVGNLGPVPVVFQEFFTEDEEYAFLQGDNGIAKWAELDLSGINADLADLGPDFDLDLLGLKNFNIDPPGLEVDEEEDDHESGPDGVKSKNAGGANVLRLFFGPEHFKEVTAKAEALVQELDLPDAAALFRQLVLEKYSELHS
jgi:hypothetical protein